MEKWDKKEKEMEQSVIRTFKLYDSKKTCPMCELVRKNNMILGSDTTKYFFLDTYEERIHDKESCFIESYIYCAPKEFLQVPNFPMLQKKATQQFNFLKDFVDSKEKN